jgi:DNA-binding transcriptional MerR regulator
MAKDKKKNFLKMHELEKLSDFSRATINFYIHEGILPLPIKSAKNMAYYDDLFIEKLMRVKELKKSNFTLSQIKQFMNAKQDGENELIMQALQNINRLLPSDSKENKISRDQIRSLGYKDETIDELIEINMITPNEEDRDFFPSYSLTICKFVKYFLDNGIPMAAAKAVVEKIMEVTQLESEAFFKYIRKPLIEKNASLDDQNYAIQKCIENINTLLPLIHLQLLKLPAEKLYLINNLQSSKES